jgi:hypothetical protein
MGEFSGFMPVQYPASPLQQIGEPHPAHHIAETVTNQDRCNLLQAPEITGSHQCLPKHQISLRNLCRTRSKWIIKRLI